MEFQKVETIVPFKETNPFLRSWLRSGKEIELLFLKKKGERITIYCGIDSKDFLHRAGWKLSETMNFKERGRRVFVKGDSHFLKFSNENYGDRVVELLNEEDSGFLRLSIKSHYFDTTPNYRSGKEDTSIERKLKERKGWKISITYRNENLGDYLCHVFSSASVQTRKGKFGLKSPVMAWWEVHQLIPTTVDSLGGGDVRVGSTQSRGDVFIDTTKNPHTLISGTSGAGKSSMIVGMMSYILENTVGKVILIDPHGDTAKKMKETGFKKFIISPDSTNSINIIRGGKDVGTSYKVAENFVSILRSFREIQYTDSMVGPRMEDIISRGVSLLASTSGLTLVDFCNILKEARAREELAGRCDNNELGKFLKELGEMSREERASTERAIGRLVNDPMIRSLVCNPEDDGAVSSALKENDLIIVDLDRSSLGYEDSRLLSNLFALYIWFEISSLRNNSVFLFLEEGQDYQSTLVADMLSSGRKFGLKAFFLTTSFKAISDNLKSLLFSNISNYIFMKLTDPDKVSVREFIGKEIDPPSDSFDFVLINPFGEERGNVTPVMFSSSPSTFKVRNYDFLTERKKRNLSSEIDAIVSEMKKCESIYFVFEEFCLTLKEYDKSEVISALKEKISKDQRIHFVGRITLNIEGLKGRHECFQVVGSTGQNSQLPNNFRVTSELISNALGKK